MKNYTLPAILLMSVILTGCGKPSPKKGLGKSINDLIGCMFAAPFIAIGEVLSSDRDIKLHRATYDRVNAEIRNKNVTAQNFWQELSVDTRNHLLFELNLWMLTNKVGSAADAYKSTAIFFSETNHLILDYDTKYKFKTRNHEHYEFAIRGGSHKNTTVISKDCENKGFDLSLVPDLNDEMNLASVQGAYDCRTEIDKIIIMGSLNKGLVKANESLYLVDAKQIRVKETKSTRRISIRNPDVDLEVTMGNSPATDSSSIALRLPNLDLDSPGTCKTLRKFPEFTK